ncbi:MAG: hypothetical protein V4655_12395 [Bdellovibrionota bacterium]
MQRLWAVFVIFAALFAPKLLGSTTTHLLEMNPVKIHVDRQDRIHVTYQKECGASFAGFLLRTSAEKELFVAVLSLRPNMRCLELTPMEELIIPKLTAKDFAGVTSLNPSTEPVFLKQSPIQNFNQFQDGEEIRFEAAYTSQCGTALGLSLYPGANGLELSILEGRASRFEACNRSTKVSRSEHINLSNESLVAIKDFATETEEPERYTLRRANTRLIQEPDSEGAKLYYFRRCTEAPVGLIRRETDSGIEISVLLASYSDISCPEGSTEHMWTPWPQKLYGETLKPFKGTGEAEPLTIKRPISYNTNDSTLSIAAHSSCQKDVGIISRESRNGYAVGILQIQNSAPCNSPLKEVNFTFDWNFADGVKRDVKPLQLVGY